MRIKKPISRGRIAPKWPLVALLALLCCLPRLLRAEIGAQTAYYEQIADAVYLAEGGAKATWPYGIRSVACEGESECRRIAINTIRNTISRYRATRCLEGEDDIACLARRYCPQGGELDNGTCQYWEKNVRYFLAKTAGEGV